MPVLPPGSDTLAMARVGQVVPPRRELGRECRVKSIWVELNDLQGGSCRKPRPLPTPAAENRDFLYLRDRPF